MRNCKLFLVVTALVVHATTAAAQITTAISWQTDLDAARAVAEKEQKLLLIHFYNDSCGPCRMLDARVFNQPTVAGAVHSHYVPVKLNTDEFPATTERFGITQIPTDVVITPSGDVVARMASPASPMVYIQQVTSIATKHQANAARQFATAHTDNGLPQQVSASHSGLMPSPADNNSFTSQGVAGMTTNPYAQPSAATPATVQPNVPAAAVPATTAQVANQQSAAGPVAMNNPYASQPVKPAQPAPPAENFASAPAATPTPGEATGPAGTAQPPAAQVATSQPTTPQTETPQLPPNSPPLGFFGYCPVSMKEDMKAAKEENRDCDWQKGDVRWGCYHRGRTYLFASAEKRDKFFADPDHYAPALSGIDPVLAIDKQQIVAGKREFGLEFGDKFYLFSSEANLRKFYNQPQRYAEGVRQAMNTAPEGRQLH